MKKIYSLLIVLFVLVSLQTKAQFACNASFTTQLISGSTVKFIPSPLTLDSPNVQHYWYFNDGSVGSNSVSPIHIFPTGTFTVRHNVVRNNPSPNIGCSDSSFQQITITQGACLISAYFNILPSNSNPLEHYYTDPSPYYISPNDSIRWTFGDGTSGSGTTGYYYATHIFATPGIYNVCFRVIKRNPNGTLSNCISEYCRLDTVVAPPCNLQAYFVNTPDSAAAPATIQFANQTVGYSNTDSITWNFGDGSAVSHAVNPVHIYTAPGLY
jgi:PKD repeat protein